MKLSEVRKEDDLYFEGPFWIISLSMEELNKGNFTILSNQYLVDFYGKPVLPLTRYQSTHEYIWNSKYKDSFGVHPYSYYPRGRVVFKDGKVYLNIPKGLPDDLIKKEVARKFDYDEFDNVFYKDPTSGNHYTFELK